MRMHRIAMLLGLLTIMLVFASCSNLPEKRTLLAAAGFKTLPATTPKQLAALHAMKAGEIKLHSGKNGPIYIFADPAKNSMMVGGPPQFKKYKTLKFQEQQADEKLLDAQVNMDNADYSAWGPDANFGLAPASDPL